VCGTGGAACQACPGNETCGSSGVCTVAASCSSANCPNGCCSGTTCIPYASESSGQCGTGGAACQPCAGGQSCSGGQCTGGGTGVGPNGGTVASLYFAVVGDTRPANDNDTANYPTAIITKIYQDLNGLNPKPQFIIGTGDYQYADPQTTNGPAQIALYMQAAKSWTGGPLFAAMGNHECNGYTTSNMDLSSGTCDGVQSNNYSAYFSQMVQPLGKSLPYYTIPINATDESWTAKFIFAACNAWDSTQQTWLQTQLATSTTYTFVIRHEDVTATTGPCVTQMNSMLSSAKYDTLIVGHSHTFMNDYATNKQVIVGNGGAGSGGTYGYGYGTFQQQSGGFLVTDYDYSTGAAQTSFTIP
jgi:hypothetical protein